ERLVQVASRVATWGPASVPCEVIVLSLQTLDDFQRVNLDIERDDEAKALLAHRHVGVETNLEPVFQALSYGRAVLDLKLPRDIDGLLLSDTGNSLRQELIG